MIDLARAEWLRLRRRGDFWILLVGFVAINAIGYISGLSSAQQIQFGPPGEVFPPEVIEQWEQMMRERLAEYAFPQSLETFLLGGRVFVAAIGAYLAAAFTGAEFDYGTIRTSLVARGDRRGFVLVRLLSVFVAGLVFLAAGLLLSTIMPLVAAAMGTPFPPTSHPDPWQAAGMIGSVALTLAFVIGLTTALSIVSRRAVAAIALMLVYTLADGAIQGLIVRFLGEDAPIRWAPPLVGGQLLFDRARGMDAAGDWPTLLAIGLPIGWAVATWLLSVWTLERADINA